MAAAWRISHTCGSSNINTTLPSPSSPLANTFRIFLLSMRTLSVLTDQG